MTLLNPIYLLLKMFARITRSYAGGACQHLIMAMIQKLISLCLHCRAKQIVDILSSIDLKIATETKLAQTQSLKKSLMQDLLTGKVRVQV